MTEFEHQKTNFPLEGKHLEVRCAGCHSNNDFTNTTTDCSGCHAEPEAHLGQFDPGCSACHNVQSWKPALFDGQPFEHESMTGFSLGLHKFDYSEDVITCKSCHSVAGYEVNPEVCVDCHDANPPGFMEDHIGQFGIACMDCHDGVDRLSDFDHETRFPLQGRHAEIDCEACHIDRSFRGTPSECVQCHAEPEIHAGFFGVKCQYCHGDDAWIPAQIRMHTFPLDHGEGLDLDCQVCHTQVYQEFTCYGCHDHQPDEIAESHQELNIAPAELSSCSSCHPTGEDAQDDEDE